MQIRNLFEALGKEAAIIFGRFNPAHKGHRAAWEQAKKSPIWYVGTNRTTVGPKDPLPFDVKIEVMKTIMPEIEGHILAETSWFTMASAVYEKHGDGITLYVVTDKTDKDWIMPTMLKQNGQQGDHGYYNFKNIEWREAPRLSSATDLRGAVMSGDRDAFSLAAGVSAETQVMGKPFFDLVAEYLLPEQEKEQERRAAIDAKKASAAAKKADAEAKRAAKAGNNITAENIEVDETSLATMRDYFAGDKNARDALKISQMRQHFSKASDAAKPTTRKEFRNEWEYQQWLKKNKLKQAEPSMAEGIMNTIANKVMGAAPEQPKYKVGQRVKYETSPDQPDWKDGGRGVGVITAYKNGHYMINGNPVNHFEIKGVVEQGVAEGSDGWIGNPAKWKEAVHQAHGPDVVFKNYSHPGQPGKRSVNAINAAGKQVGVYQRHNKMGMVQPNMQGVAENFADGKNPQDKGDSARHGIPKKASVGSLRKIAKQGGRKGQLAHWQANMKAGREKKESVERESFEEARMSAAARLGKAWDAQKAKSDASRQRAKDLLNPPKPEPKKTNETAGVGIITKQNTTVDVNKGTPRKNLKAFRLVK